MEIIRNGSTTTLSKQGVQSEQLVFPENSPSRRVTITRHRAAGDQHAAPARKLRTDLGRAYCSKQRTEPFAAGDVARFAEAIFMACMSFILPTSPPIDFRSSYRSSKLKIGDHPGLTMPLSTKTPGNPRLPAHQGPARIRRREAGTDLARGQARLSDPRRHTDHAARGSAPDRLSAIAALPNRHGRAKGRSRPSSTGYARP
jgi:hypothetical protein